MTFHHYFRICLSGLCYKSQWMFVNSRGQVTTYCSMQPSSPLWWFVKCNQRQTPKNWRNRGKYINIVKFPPSTPRSDRRRCFCSLFIDRVFPLPIQGGLNLSCLLFLYCTVGYSFSVTFISTKSTTNGECLTRRHMPINIDFQLTLNQNSSIFDFPQISLNNYFNADLLLTHIHSLSSEYVC